MFGFLKDKLKSALSKFSRKVDEEVKEEKVEVEKEVVEEPKEEVKEEKPIEVPKEKVVEEKKQFLKICPKCGSIDVDSELSNAAKVQYGVPLNYVCNDCGFGNTIFPEIEKSEVENFRKEIKTQVKEEVKEEIKEEKPIEEKKQFIKICPKCGSDNTTIPPAGMDIGLTVPDFCRDCEFRGNFPEIEKSEVENFRKEIKKEIKEEIKEEKPIEVPKEKPVEEKPKEKKGFFQRITETITTKKISEAKFDELFFDLEVILLENNTAVEVIEKIKQDLKKELVEKQVPRSKILETVINTLKKSIEEVLDIEPVDLLEESKKKKPLVICFVGINGSGKTTSIAKVANLMLKNNKSVVLAAADTFRAAAIDQLQLHADKLGVKLIKHDYGSDAAAVAFDAVKHAEAKNKDIVLIDTAGRLHSDKNLVEEMKKIVRVSKPDFIVFVGESITGNDCVEQAQKFDEAVGIDGIILSKADVDEKGGTAISISYVTKKPILYMGVGQEYDDLELFNKEKILNSIGL